MEALALNFEIPANTSRFRLLSLGLFFFLTFTNFANLWMTVFYLMFALALIAPQFQVALPKKTWIIFLLLLSLAFGTSLMSINAVDPSVIAPTELLRFARYDFKKYLPSDESLLLRAIAILKVAASFLVASFELSRPGSKKDFLFAFEMIFRTLLFFWFFQFGFYHLTGMVLDPSGAGRFVGTSSEGLLFRATGFFNEPGTYGNVMFALAVIRFLLLRKGFDLWNRVLFVSLLGSFSLFGWFFAALLVLVLTRWTKESVIKFLSIGGVSAIVIGPIFAQYFAYRLDREVSTSYSLATKVWAYDSWLQQGLWRQFIGNWGWNDCGCLYNDSGLFFVILNEFGLTALLLGIGFIIYNFKKLRIRLGFLLAGMMLLKMGFLQPLMGVFWATYLSRYLERRPGHPTEPFTTRWEKSNV